MGGRRAAADGHGYGYRPYGYRPYGGYSYGPYGYGYITATGPTAAEPMAAAATASAGGGASGASSFRRLARGWAGRDRWWRKLSVRLKRLRTHIYMILGCRVRERERIPGGLGGPLGWLPVTLSATTRPSATISCHAKAAVCGAGHDSGPVPHTVGHTWLHDSYLHMSQTRPITCPITSPITYDTGQALGGIGSGGGIGP